MYDYDVIIIGAGPSGIAVADNLNCKTLLIDKGKSLEKRTSKTSGFGGSGLFSDGKLVYSDKIGGNLNKLIPNSTEYLDKSLKFFGVSVEKTKNNYSFINKALKYKLNYVNTKYVHLGTDCVQSFLENKYNELNNKVDILLDSEVIVITKDIEDPSFPFVVCGKGFIYSSKYLILAPGREGSEWLSDQLLTKFNIKNSGNKVDLGIRMEIPSEITKELTDYSYEFKLIYHSKLFDDEVRTFCVCPNGFVVRENVDNLITCNGHSYKNTKSNYTNFALLVSIPFDFPINPLKYGKSIVSLSNNISENGVIVQRLKDLRQGRRTTKNRLYRNSIIPSLENPFPGDLSSVLPYRYLSDLLDMINALDDFCPGIGNDDNLLYGVEAKFYSNILDLSNKLETKVNNLFCIGDGAGVSRGILQAVASGLVVSEEINKREE